MREIVQHLQTRIKVTSLNSKSLFAPFLTLNQLQLALVNLGVIAYSFASRDCVVALNWNGDVVRITLHCEL